ncbi:hypothetical protein FJ366_04105 [Candidatus Dependentiae bacterium]|nr:hypothetical protein [Candidatus Dependentiae bacterium]
MKNFLLIILCALSVPCIPTPGSSSPVQFAHTLTVNVKKVSKLPDGQDHIQFPADDFLDFYHTKQSPQAVLCSKNEFLKILFTQIQSRIASLRAAKTTRKTEIFSATITLPELPFTFCVKYTLRKQGNEIHIVLSAFVPTATDAKIFSVVTNFCNAQVPVLSFFQKNKTALFTFASLAGAAGVGFLVKKEINRREANRKLKEREAPLREFKKYLTTTPFLYFALSDDHIEFPNLTASANLIASNITQYIPRYYENRQQELTVTGFISTEKPLTNEQLKELATGCFKESTINLLGQFQEDFMIALAQDGNNSANTKQKTDVLMKFIEKLVDLQKTDPVEVKRILLFKPKTIYEKLRAARFYNKAVWKDYIITETTPYPIQTPLCPVFILLTTFCQALNESMSGTYCLKDYFPSDFAIFKDLHKVKL